MESLASFAGLLQTEEEIKDRYPYFFFFFLGGGDGGVLNFIFKIYNFVRNLPE